MFEFVVAVLLLELTPGPNMAYLATLAVARGRSAGLYATLGVAVGLGVHATGSVLGAGALILYYPWLYEFLRWIGVAYLLYLAWEGWQTERASAPQIDFATKPGPLFLRGFLSNVFNPKSIIFFVSVVPSFIQGAPDASAIPLQLTIYGIIYLGIATAVHMNIVILAAQLRPRIMEGSNQKLVRRILSIGLALVAIWLVWSTRR